jgi:hypothetical protein
MRPLLLDDAAQAKAAEVVAYAEQHHYRPGDPTPGDNPRFVANLSTYRAVFTYTHADGMIYRHLSVSVPGKKFANPAAVFAIADLFGFTGWDQKRIDRVPKGWICDVKDDEHCIVVAQPVARDSDTISH